MARQAALVTTWSHPVRGREGRSLEGFTDFLTFWGKKAADGAVSDPEPYFAYDGSHGMAIVKGPSDVLQAAMESEEHERILNKAQLTVEDLRQELYLSGDDEIQRGIRIFSETANELGYL